MIALLRGADRVATPWKNGGGMTREVAIWPPRSTLNDFDWRVSIAEVHDAGPFSPFEGIDRTLVILEGCLALTFGDRAVELHPGSAPFAFAGDLSCAGRPIGGAVTDLNVMTRRGACTAHIRRIAAGTASLTAASTLVVASAPTAIRLGAHALSLAPFDAVLIDEPCEPSPSGAAFAIGFV